MKKLIIAVVAFAMFGASPVWAAEPAPKSKTIEGAALGGVLSLAASPQAGTFHPVVWHNDLFAVNTASGTVWLLRDQKWIKFADGIVSKSLMEELLEEEKETVKKAN